MARTISDEEIKLSIIINGDSAQKQLFELEKSTRKATQENVQLKLELGRVERSLGKNSNEYKELTAKIKANNTTIANNKALMRELQNQIGITGLTMKQLSKEAGILRMKLQNAVPGSAAYQRYQSELQQIENRLNQLRGRANEASLSVSSLANTFNKYQALAFSVIAALTGVVLSFQKIIDLNGKLADAQDNVRKTTGMTKDEVNELTKSFGLLETRTSRIDLLKIAEQGGRLGIPKAEIQDFVKNMNVASVALGDSFTGGVDEVAEKLGKIKFLFQETKDVGVDLAYNAIGSAINDLGANGVASEANIAEFTKRIGSLTDVLKPTVQETLALGAAFEESGIDAETSSRAYNIFMKQAATESGKFAKVMGISQKAVEDMINTNPMEFMLNFSKGLKNMDATEVAKTLDFLGVNADGANKVIGAMGNNFDRFHELIDLSNKSFSDGSSLVTEYDIKNNNLAATLEKVGKKVNGWFSSEGFNNWLFSLVNGFAKLIGATNDVDGSSQKWRNTLVFTAKVIAIVISAMVTSVAWQKLLAMWTARNTEATLLYNIASKARAFADGVAIVSSQLLAGATMLLSGNVKGATQAFRVMTATLMTTPWGFILGAIAAIGTAYLLFSENAKEAVTAQSVFKENSKLISDELNKQRATFDSLISVVNDSKASVEARTAALAKAKEIGGEYTEGLTLENVQTFEGKKMLDAYNKSLEKKITLQILEKQRDKLMDEIAEKSNKSLEDEVDIWDKLWANAKRFNNTAGAGADVLVTAAKRRTVALKELQDKLKFTNDQMREFLKANPDIIETIETETEFTAPGDDPEKIKKNPNSTQEEINKLLYDNDARWAELTLKLKRQLEDDKIAAMFDGFEKEMAIENLRYEREIEDLKNQKVHADEMAKLDEDIAKAKEAKDITKYEALLTIKKTWQDRNLLLDQQVDRIIEQKEVIHNLKIATIKEKEAKRELKELANKYEQEKLLRETAYYEELALLGNNETAKAALKKKYEAEELKHQEEFLRILLQEQQNILNNLNANVDFTLLSPKERLEFEQTVNEVLNEIAKLKAGIAGLKGEDTSKKDFSILQGTGTDIFGYSPEQWNQVFSNFDNAKERIQALETVIGGLQNAWSMYSAFVDATQQRELQNLDRTINIKKKKYKNDLDNGLINKSQYDKAIKKLDDDKEKKQAELEYKKAKRDRITALFNIVANTGIGIMKAVAQFPVTGGMPWSGIIAGMGALQAATVLATPLPAKGYEQGLYGEYVKREQDGKVFKSSGKSKMQSGLFTKPHILVGEGPEDTPEMVIDKKAYSKISPNVKNALINELRGIKGFENGYYNPQSKRIEIPAGETPSTSSGTTEELLRLAISVVAQNTEVMQDLRDNPIMAFISSRDYNSIKELDEAIKKYNKNKELAKK